MVKEPMISVGVMSTQSPLEFRLVDCFEANRRVKLASGEYVAHFDGEGISLFQKGGEKMIKSRSLSLLPAGPKGSQFVLRKVPIGKGFHWEYQQDLILLGELHIQSFKRKELQVISRVPLEIYLSSVISSEMRGMAPREFLKAHAIISRSWAIRRIEGKNPGIVNGSPSVETSDEETVLRWTGADIHKGFDVCADDHCQRYRGFVWEDNSSSERAVQQTRGQVLTYGDEICDTRYCKCCGGMTENFRTAWEDRDLPYLRALPDSDHPPPGFCFPLSEEQNAKAWITGSPKTFCNTRNQEVLNAILQESDRQTTDFFRWQTLYSQEEIRKLITTKTGKDLGMIRDLIPVERGPSGRISRLQIVGTTRTLTVGKELEIRRVLSSAHLYSSAFIIETKRGRSGIPRTFRLIGAGWGHGVGLCQIGAAVMATQGRNHEEILLYYFPGTKPKGLY